MLIATNRCFTEEELSSIIVCEPVTRRGRQALGALGLSLDDMSVETFYSFESNGANGLYIPPRYREGENFKIIDTNESSTSYNYNSPFHFVKVVFLFLQLNKATASNRDLMC